VFPPLYAIIHTAWLRRPELTFAAMMAESGVKLIQYRNKQISSRELFRVLQTLATQLVPRGIRLIVNDRPDIATLTGAGGVHVGQEDLPVERARAICGATSWVGVSTHNLEQVREADSTSADYMAIGPIFSTTTKQKPEPVVGIEFIRRARAITRKPLVAIGGITLERAEEIFRAGADSIAVAQDLFTASDPAARAREYLELACRVANLGIAARN